MQFSSRDGRAQDALKSFSLLPRSPSKRGALWFSAAVCALAAWMDFSRFQHHQHADSLVPILCSLDRWTPFYWGEARYGMLVPLIARPISDPLANLLVQVGIDIALGFCAFALLARYLLPDDRDWVLPAAISTSLFIALAGENERFDTFATQPYAASIAVGLSGLWLIRAGPSGRFALRAVAAAVLLGLAEWINVGAVLVLGPLAVARLIVEPGAKQGGWKNAPRGLSGIVLLLGWTFALQSLAKSVAGTSVVPEEWADRAEWLDRERVWIEAFWRQLRPHHWEACALTAAGLGVASLLLPMFRRGAKARLVAAGALAAVAVSNFLATGLVDWVEANGFAVRYALPAMLVAGVALGQLAAIPLDAIPALKGALRSVTAWLGVAAAVGISYGLPGPGHVEHAFDSPWHPSDVSWTTAAREVISSRATHVTGNYWEVWPVVFRSKWLRHQQGSPDQVFGLANRSEPTLDMARSVPMERTRVAVVRARGGGLGGARALLGYASWDLVERRSLIEVWRPR